jgi:pSer/pThr/pTyr-binding forkhead associated (FHA) protein
MKKLTLFFPPQFGDRRLAGKSVSLHPEDRKLVTLGRAVGNDIQIRIQTVSRRHAVLTWIDPADRWVLCDLHSSGGTVLNSNPLLPDNPEPLDYGDKFWLGTPEALIAVVRSEEDTVKETFSPPLPPAQAQPETALPTSPKTWPEVAGLALVWLVSGRTLKGQLVRVTLLVGGTAVLIFVQ